MRGAEFIQKPFTPDALSRQVRGMLDSNIPLSLVRPEQPSHG
jgi:hypothetical protein